MPFLVLDLEMSGTEAGWHEIIQLGAELYSDDWNLIDSYLTNVYPENEESFSLPAIEVHGLTQADLDDAPSMYEVLPAFETWICQKLGRPLPHNIDENSADLRDVIICGQSVINDINFLKYAYRDEKRKWAFSNVLLDLHTLSYFIFQIMKKNGEPTPKSLSLGAISQHFGFTREDASHNALEDAQLTAKCLKAIMELGWKLKK